VARQRSRGWKREECDTVHDEWPEEALYQGVLDRKQPALEELIKRYSRELSYFIRVVLEHTGTAQDVEECTNDLFATVWLEIESYDPTRGSLRTWITMRAKYIALDKRRQIQRRQAITMSSLESSESLGNYQGESYIADRSALRMTDTSMDRLLEQRERQDELRRALESLTEQDRIIVYMRYFLLAPTEEICAQMKLSRHAIDTRLWRARKALQNAIEDLRHERV
jgi:RNA polymerase sigma-70 factor (ECF subfamily)